MNSNSSAGNASETYKTVGSSNYPKFYTTIDGLDCCVELGNEKMGSNEITIFIRYTYIKFVGYLSDYVPIESLEHARKSIVSAFEDGRFTLKFVELFERGDRNLINLVFEYGALNDKKLTYSMTLQNMQVDTNFQLSTRGFDPIISNYKLINKDADDLRSELAKTKNALANSVAEYNKLVANYNRLVREMEEDDE
jgi:hypothetical protein